MIEKIKGKVLFICTHNSARSQMAEGFLRALYGGKYEAYSAGTRPLRIDPYSVRVMAEIGIDISANRSKSIDEFLGKEFDYVITVCNFAKEASPVFPGGHKYLHKDFEDPTEFKGTEEEILIGFRRVRDEIRNWIEETFDVGKIRGDGS